MQNESRAQQQWGEQGTVSAEHPGRDSLNVATNDAACGLQARAVLRGEAASNAPGVPARTAGRDGADAATKTRQVVSTRTAFQKSTRRRSTWRGTHLKTQRRRRPFSARCTRSKYAGCFMLAGVAAALRERRLRELEVSADGLCQACEMATSSSSSRARMVGGDERGRGPREKGGRDREEIGRSTPELPRP